MPFCPTCNDWYYSRSEHQCNPIWYVWSAEDNCPEDAHSFHAVDSESACEKWGEYEDSQGDYLILNGSEEEVYVLQEGSYDELIEAIKENDKETERKCQAQIEKFEVRGRLDPVYTARQIGE